MFNLELNSALESEELLFGGQKSSGWVQGTTLCGVTRFTEALKARLTRHRDIERQTKIHPKIF